ncbi:hypothetical protein [Bacillus sp. OK048]|uniref:hypothetical protein n=1 Tax=Bacillus sp. OK048 TaxID=1882761 RepID=UPI000B859F32|nr:hypothetical protein [Bacillus sp. OK048]
MTKPLRKLGESGYHKRDDDQTPSKIRGKWLSSQNGADIASTDVCLSHMLNEWSFAFQAYYYLEVEKMSKNNPIEYTGKVLNERNQLTGPDDSGKASYPERPKNVSIQDPGTKK